MFVCVCVVIADLAVELCKHPFWQALVFFWKHGMLSPHVMKMSFPTWGRDCSGKFMRNRSWRLWCLKSRMILIFNTIWSLLLISRRIITFTALSFCVLRKFQISLLMSPQFRYSLTILRSLMSWSPRYISSSPFHYFVVSVWKIAIWNSEWVR